MNSLGDSARIGFVCLAAIGGSLIGTAVAQCPPSGLQASFLDISVAGSTQPTDQAWNPSLAATAAGQILVAFELYDGVSMPPIQEIFAAEYSASGAPLQLPYPLTAMDNDPYLFALGQLKVDPSVAISNGVAAVAFLGTLDKGSWRTGSCDIETPCEALNCDTAACAFSDPPTCNFGPNDCSYDVDSTFALFTQFSIGTTPIPITIPKVPGRRLVNHDVSASYSPSAGARLAWGNAGHCFPDAPFGWMTGPNWNTGSPIRSCTPYPCDNQTTTNCGYSVADLQPCIVQRSDGYTVVAWADPEAPADFFSHLNIYVRILDPNGDPVGTATWVNDTSTGIIEHHPSSQISPAVAIDDPDFNGRSNVVVTWAGYAPPGVPVVAAIYARRFILELGGNPPSTAFLRDPNPSLGEGVKSDFLVDNQIDAVPQSLQGASPTVALSAKPSDRGRFIIAWNSNPPSGQLGDEIHGQYFDTDGRPMGCEFRMTQNASNTTNRVLSASARHTLAYASNGNVVLSYTINGVIVGLTIIPDGTAESLAGSVSCCKGDANRDGVVNGLDIFAFKKLILLYPNSQALSAVQACPADVDLNGYLDLADVPPFVTLLLEGATCGGNGFSRGMADCNANEVPDANDIADATSLDCNNNFIPDECDIDTNDPDGNELVSTDVDANGVPDECQPDCNANVRPDSADIACGGGNTCGGIVGSYDVNSNGIPDECDPDCNNNDYPDDYDIAMSTSADCNANGTPDECETDCNANGVSDDCDIDPLDPDGNDEISDDCNQDGMPDECNMELPPPYGSFDCNENGILDECDIAAEFSEDANSNGVPDECEGGGNLMAPGGNPSRDRQGAGSSALIDDGDSPTGPNAAAAMQAPNQDAAWEALYEWAMAQCWGPDCELSPSVQFQAYVNKLAELGLTIP